MRWIACARVLCCCAIALWSGAASSDRLRILAGSPLGRGNLDGPAGVARLQEANAVAAAADGRIFTGGWLDRRIRVVDPDGSVRTLLALDGGVSGLVARPEGDLVATLMLNHAIVRISLDRRVDTLIGSDSAPRDAGATTSPPIASPLGLALVPHGALYVADPQPGAIFEVGSDGAVRRVFEAASLAGTTAAAWATWSRWRSIARARFTTHGATTRCSGSMPRGEPCSWPARRGRPATSPVRPRVRSTAYTAWNSIRPVA